MDLSWSIKIIWYKITTFRKNFQLDPLASLLFICSLFDSSSGDFAKRLKQINSIIWNPKNIGEALHVTFVILAAQFGGHKYNLDVGHFAHSCQKHPLGLHNWTRGFSKLGRATAGNNQAPHSLKIFTIKYPGLQINSYYQWFPSAV